jgi:hypothetical protein
MTIKFSKKESTRPGQIQPLHLRGSADVIIGGGKRSPGDAGASSFKQGD